MGVQTIMKISELIAIHRFGLKCVALTAATLAFVCSAPVGAAPNLTVAVSSVQVGSVASLPVTFDPTTNSVAALQFDLALPAAMNMVSYSTGTNVSSAIKMIESNLCGGTFFPCVSSPKTWRFVVFASTAASNLTSTQTLIQGQNPVPVGVAMTAQISVPKGTPLGTTAVSVSNAVFVNPAAPCSNPNFTTCPEAVAPGTTTGATITVLSRCDVNLNGKISPADAVAEINQILGLSPCTEDVNLQGHPCGPTDLVTINNAILAGGICAAD